jgi:hypothetical protein
MLIFRQNNTQMEKLEDRFPVSLCEVSTPSLNHEMLEYIVRIRDNSIYHRVSDDISA